MKTFWERFLEDVTRKLEAGEIDQEKADRWVEEIQRQLGAYAERHPHAPIVQMPVGH